MAENFKYDVFLSHSSKDKAVVRDIAERLRADGIRVWFDEWAIRPGDSIPSKVEEGLENSRVLVLCMSAHAFGSDWATLESQTFRFRDPLNKELRFIPVRLDESPIKGSLAQFLYLNWKEGTQGQEYPKLLKSVYPLLSPSRNEKKVVIHEEAKEHIRVLNYNSSILAYSFNFDHTLFLSGAEDNTIRLWDSKTGRCLRVFKGHTGDVFSVMWSADQHYALSGAVDNTVRLWDVGTGRCLKTFEGHTGAVFSVAWSTDQRYALSGSEDDTIRLWDIETGRCLKVLEGHAADVWHVIWSANSNRILSASEDMTIRLWDIIAGRCLKVLEGHTGTVFSIALSVDQRYILSGSEDTTVRLWDVQTGKCLQIFRGHTGSIWDVALSVDQRYALSGSEDTTVRLWDVQTGKCLQVSSAYIGTVFNVAWSLDQNSAVSGNKDGSILTWDLSEFFRDHEVLSFSGTTRLNNSDQIQYTNAKVLFIGESGAGKTGLSKVLSGEEWQPSDSTVGAWATQFKLPSSPNDDVEREIWLWDFGGQADQRLIHQLYMDETALVVLVFDGQKEDTFETLGQWDRDISRASHKEFSKLLVVGRVDAGGMRAASRSQVDAFMKERGFTGKLLETSAKKGIGCDELRQAIVDSIRWENIPWRTTPLLFKKLKEGIVRLKDEGRVLMRFNELRETLQLRLSGEISRFTDEELKAVLTLLSGPGVIWELKFGSWILLQPEYINAYAQAVIQTLRSDIHERGCLPERQVLEGELTYLSSVQRLKTDEEKFVLLAMYQMLVERGLCLRQDTESGPLLIFPSYYRRERPELVGHPAVLVSYRFNGFLDEIYATLVVQLHHTTPFEQDQLWRYAADFKTLEGKQLGVKLIRHSEGTGELEVYFDPTISLGEKIIFSKYVHEHLRQKTQDVVRLRHYVCPHCGTPAGNPDVAMKKLTEGKKDIPCIECDDTAKRIPLWDKLEELFADPEIKQKVRKLQEQSNIVLDNESKERTLVGEVISTVSLAGQISRELTTSDHGIDMEIEFKSDEGQATGQKVYLQLKSGDSYLTKRKSDDTEIFYISKLRHADYWREQAFPVMLVIRTSDGNVRWMDIRDYLIRESENGKKPVNQIVFTGERLDVMSVRRLRDKVLD